MKKQHSNQQLDQKSKAAHTAVSERYQARLLQSILAIEPPALLVGPTEELALSALAGGLRADICDDSLEQLGRLAQACLERNLEAKLYWQPLTSLSLPQRYANIVLAPRSWQALARRAESELLQRTLAAQLLPKGQLHLLLSRPQGLETLAA